MSPIAPRGGQAGDLRLHALAPDVYIYRGFFSNSGVLVLPDAVVVIDTQITPLGGERLKTEIRKITDRPVRFVINTHYHGDHAGGNAAFAEAEIIGTEDTARYVIERDQERLEYANTFGLVFQDVPPVPPPTRTFKGRMTLEVGAEKLELMQLGRVETPDACVVWWPARRVLVAGDGVATTGYPYLGVPFLDEGLQDDGQWIGFLEALDGMEPEVLIAGHGTPIVGAPAIRARLRLLMRLFRDLFSAVKEELARGTPVAELVRRVDDKLAHYRKRRDLEENTVGQKFAIYRALNSAMPERRGKGWWHDFRPSVVRRASAAEAEAELARAGGDALAIRRKHAPLAIAALELHVHRHPTDAAARAQLADALFDAAAGVSPVVDATEFIVAATAAARAALALDRHQPIATLQLGCVEIWSAMVLAQPMASGIAHLETALTAPLTARQRRKAHFFLGKAHQCELRDDLSDRHLRQVLPWWLRWLFPLIRRRLRSIP